MSAAQPLLIRFPAVYLFFYLFLLLSQRVNNITLPTMRKGPPHTTRQNTTWGKPMPLSGSIHSSQAPL